MTQREIRTQREWEALEKERRLKVEHALFGMPFFVRAITRPRSLSGWRPGMEDPIWDDPTGSWQVLEGLEMPWVWLMCPTNNHKIRPVRIKIDTPKGATRPRGLPPIELCHRDGLRDDVMVAKSAQAVMRSDESSWDDSKTVWTCAFEGDDGEGCYEELGWQDVFCQKHIGESEPLVMDELFGERMYIRCPNKGGCKYAERHNTYKYSTLLVMFAQALYGERKKILLGR